MLYQGHCDPFGGETYPDTDGPPGTPTAMNASMSPMWAEWWSDTDVTAHDHARRPIIINRHELTDNNWISECVEAAVMTYNH